jgi:RNA polymerase sigma-70 factor (ECF subfamily)
VSALDRPGAWARRVTINLAISGRRRLRSEAEALVRVDRRPVTEVTLDDDRSQADQFWLAVRGLPARQRAAVALHYLEDRSVDEVAQVLGCAPGTVKAQLHEARATLARALAPAEEERCDPIDDMGRHAAVALHDDLRDLESTPRSASCSRPARAATNPQRWVRAIARREPSPAGGGTPWRALPQRSC